VLDQPEPMNHVASLLDVSDVNGEFVSHLRVSPRRS
jgi:hypothetical protein